MLFTSTFQEFERQFPVSHEVVLEHGNKPVSALCMDPSGARVVTGGYDYEVQFWDFGGMGLVPPVLPDYSSM